MASLLNNYVKLVPLKYSSLRTMLTHVGLINMYTTLTTIVQIN